jgi:hypothetical protein
MGRTAHVLLLLLLQPQPLPLPLSLSATPRLPRLRSVEDGYGGFKKKGNGS